MTDPRQPAKPSCAPFVPVYAGDAIVGRAYETPDKSWAARMDDGTPLGVHLALVDARAAILARYYAPLSPRQLFNASGQIIP